jgi:beta propeller repeat protein
VRRGWPLLLIGMLFPLILHIGLRSGSAPVEPSATPAQARLASAGPSVWSPFTTSTRFLAAVSEVMQPVIEHPASQEAPRISGRRVVWHDARNGPTDIFLADLDRGEIENVTATGAWEIWPDIDGDIVVWLDAYSGLGIHGVDLRTRQVFTVTSGQHELSRPRISGDVVVWADDRRGEWDVYGYRLSTQEEFAIATAPGNQHDPDIDGQTVVWWDSRGGNAYNDHIYAYDLSSGAERPIATNPGDKHSPVVSGNWVVWLDDRNGNWDIYAYHLAENQEQPLILQPGDQRELAIEGDLLAWQDQAFGSWDVYLYSFASDIAFPISRAPSIQKMPAISADTVIWQDNRNHQWDIFAFDWRGAPPPVIEYPVAHPSHLQVGALPQGRILLQWQDNSLNEEGFQIQRARGITGVDWAEIVTLPANVSVYTDTPGILDESFWYRVRAFTQSGLSAYTNESFNSTFASAPNLDELYLMALINEARADPAAFGYPDYPPVPPMVHHPLLNYSAHAHSQSILNADGQFGHCDPAERCPTERAQALGYPGLCGENLVQGLDGYSEVEGVNRAFLSSEGHRENMLAPGLVEAGIGHAYDPSKGTVWPGQYTEVFCGRDGVVLPAAPSGAVVPYTGTTATEFTFMATFYSADGDAPTRASVFIDDRPHDLALSSGVAAHGTYRYTTTLPLGFAHQTYFEFGYGSGLTARWPQTGALDLPDVRPFLPDLQVTSLGSTQLVAGREGRLIAWVLNEGEIPADDIAVRFFLNHPTTGGEAIGATQIISHLEPGASASIDAVWSPPGVGHFSIFAWVDPANLIQEASESNNLASAVLAVREAGLTWFVDGRVANSGAGRTPETAFKTIEEALSSALPGDAIQVAPGVYATHFIVPEGVALIGVGAGETILNGGGAPGTVVYLNRGSRLEGFTITGSGNEYFDAGVWHSEGPVTLRHNRLVGNSVGFISWCFDSACGAEALIEFNLFANNRRAGVDSNGESMLQILHNTFVGNRDGLFVNNPSSLIANNLIIQNQGQGLTNFAGAATQNNNVWGNGADYVGGGPGEGDLAVDPLFRDPASGDFRLTAGSPVIGRGNPPGADMGAFPFVAVGEPPAYLGISRINDSWSLTWDDVGAHGYFLYLGAMPVQYRQWIDVGATTTYQLTNEVAAGYDAIGVSSYTQEGDESWVRNFALSPNPTPPASLTPLPPQLYLPLVER